MGVGVCELFINIIGVQRLVIANANVDVDVDVGRC